MPRKASSEWSPAPVLCPSQCDSGVKSKRWHKVHEDTCRILTPGPLMLLIYILQFVNWIKPHYYHFPSKHLPFHKTSLNYFRPPKVSTLCIRQKLFLHDQQCIYTVSKCCPVQRRAITWTNADFFSMRPSEMHKLSLIERNLQINWFYNQRCVIIRLTLMTN